MSPPSTTITQNAIDPQKKKNVVSVCEIIERSQKGGFRKRQCGYMRYDGGAGPGRPGVRVEGRADASLCFAVLRVRRCALPQ